MISDNIEVETRRVYDNHSFGEPLKINIQDQDNIFYIRAGKNLTPGTSTTLNLREDHPWKNAHYQQIVNFLVKTIPFPPFPIEFVIGDNPLITHRPVEPRNILLNDLKNDHNLANDNLRVFEMIFDGTDGITGKGEVILIENNELSKENIHFTSKPIKINGHEITLKSFLKVDTNSISFVQEQFDLKKIDTEEISTHPSHTHLRESKSAISLHGIELPFSLFNKWQGDMYQRSKIHWPICVLLKINIGGKLDLNLNSARTEVLKDEKWVHFERVLANIILKNIKMQSNDEYWKIFKEWVGKKKAPNNAIFLEVLESI
jgi:hypothetical protein